MVTLKIIKAISPACDVKNSSKAFHQQVTNLQLWGSLLLKINIKGKRTLDSLPF